MNAATLLLIGSSLSLILPGALAASSCTEEDSQSLNVSLQSNRLSIEARNVPLIDLLREIGRLAGFDTRHLPGRPACRLVSVSVDGQPVTSTVLQLLRGTNRIVFYSAPASHGQQAPISSLWLLAAGSAVNEADGAVNENTSLFSEDLEQADAKSRSEAVLRLAQAMATANEHDQVLLLARLAQILQQDPDALVRARAATALGSLADYRSIIDLEMALGDEHQSVRVQAMTALAQIGSARVGVILGAILLNPSIDASERVVAAQLLWRLDSETARGFLRMAAVDEIEQVSQAASRAPLTLSDSLLSPPSGFGVSE